MTTGLAPETTQRPERVDLAHVAPQRWRNGAGVTREIAVHPVGTGDGAAAAGGGFDWRVSVAEVDRAAPFSVFPGIERHIVLLHGAGLVLASADAAVDHRLDRPGAPLRFAGEAIVEGRPIEGPCSDFNVMARRAAFTAEVEWHDAPAVWPAGPTTLLFGADGIWQVDAAGAPTTLAPGQALLWRGDAPALACRPEGAGRLIAVRFHATADR